MTANRKLPRLAALDLRDELVRDRDLDIKRLRELDDDASCVRELDAS